jgi:hypothetical protein
VLADTVPYSEHNLLSLLGLDLLTKAVQISQDPVKTSDASGNLETHRKFAQRLKLWWVDVDDWMFAVRDYYCVLRL